MRDRKTMSFITFAILGACCATVCDAIHVHTHTLSYPVPFLFGQAWWVFPGFLVAFLFMENAYALMIGRLPGGIRARMSASKGGARETVEAAAIFALVYLLSGFGNYEPEILSVIFYGIFLLRWLFTYERTWVLILAVTMGIGGMLAEGAMAAAGWVTYRHADVFNVPFWLGGLYMHGAFALREGMRYFVYGHRRID